MKRTGAIVVGERDMLQAGLVATLDRSRFKVTRELGYESGLGGRIQVAKASSLYLVVESLDRPEAAKVAIETIRQVTTEACVVFIATTSNETGWAFGAGADGCLPHTISAHALVAALELLICKEVVVGVSLAIANRVVERLLERPSLETSASLLSMREREVLAYVARGDSNKRIARALQICEATVKGHVRTVLRKIGASNRTQAAVMANDMLSSFMISSAVNGHC